MRKTLDGLLFMDIKDKGSIQGNVHKIISPTPENFGMFESPNK